MLSEQELVVLDGWERDGIILNLTEEDLAVFAGDNVGFCTCADGSMDTCCHKRRLKKKLIAVDPADKILQMSGKFISKVGHGHDSNRWYGGAAAFAESYNGFNKENAIFKRDQEIMVGMEKRGLDHFENILHWPCVMLIAKGHELEDVLLMAREAHEFIRAAMNPMQQMHSYLHVKKACPVCEDIKQRIFKFCI